MENINQGLFDEVLSFTKERFGFSSNEELEVLLHSQRRDSFLHELSRYMLAVTVIYHSNEERMSQVAYELSHEYHFEVKREVRKICLGLHTADEIIKLLAKATVLCRAARGAN